MLHSLGGLRKVWLSKATFLHCAMEVEGAASVLAVLLGHDGAKPVFHIDP